MGLLAYGTMASVPGETNVFLKTLVCDDEGTMQTL